MEEQSPAISTGGVHLVIISTACTNTVKMFLIIVPICIKRDKIISTLTIYISLNKVAPYPVTKLMWWAVDTSSYTRSRHT